MRLRNKKTGKIYGLGDDLYIEYTASGSIEVRISLGDGYISAYYDSLEKFNEEWEDYTPKELQIKDERIRKLVRDWAKLAQSTGILIVNRITTGGDSVTEFFSQDKYMSLEVLGRFDGLEDMKEYTIEELCGSEE